MSPWDSRGRRLVFVLAWPAAVVAVDCLVSHWVAGWNRLPHCGDSLAHIDRGRGFYAATTGR